MDSRLRQETIAEEWMIDRSHPSQSISRLKTRATYADTTIWWLVVQLDLLDKNSSYPQLRQD